MNNVVYYWLRPLIKYKKSRVGNPTGGKVFLYADNFRKDYNNMLEKKINFVRAPSTELYGTVAVFEDLHGNLRYLIEFKKAS